ncbi:hypothetical protein PR202_ga06809 [Eleusine coracana subsp. coracana]|uniref:SEC7 domain-containing protein n=1 Tax=Eleusine coracana subsp. coracana TaxID=191504 RepID=A0AAV5BYB7_ELECO|nr:hypothetical protein PR202_ga06809 [Eleusine coracana subsp. coracana]
MAYFLGYSPRLDTTKIGEFLGDPDELNLKAKKKMMEEDFICNNRTINDRKDMPWEYLSQLFHSIASNAITVFSTTAAMGVQMTPSRWADLVKRSRAMEPSRAACDLKHKLSREAFIAAVATLATIFDCADNEETLNQCVEGPVSVARVARYGLDDVLDELLCCLYMQVHDAAEPNVVDCVLTKLKRLKLLPPSVISSSGHHDGATGGVRPPGHHPRPFSSAAANAGVIWQRGAGTRVGHDRAFSQFLSLDTGGESLLSVSSEFDNNLKIIQ